MTDQTLTTGRSLSEFTAQLASAQPAPGGGGAAALAGALAASLAAMAANAANATAPSFAHQGVCPPGLGSRLPSALRLNARSQMYMAPPSMASERLPKPVAAVIVL